MPLLPDRSFWEWGAGWAFGILILTLTLAREIRSRRQPRRILCREVARTTLARIQKEAGDRLAIRFDRKQVKFLAQLETELTNTGLEEIKDIELTVTFEESTRILDASARVLPEVAGYTITRTELAPNAVKLTIPYLNSFPLYRQKIRAVFVCNGSIETVQITGGGAGWSVKSVQAASQESLKVSSRNLRIAALVCALLAIPFYVACSNNSDRSAASQQIVALALQAEQLKQQGLGKDAPERKAAESQQAALLEEQSAAAGRSFAYGLIGSLLAAGSLFLLASSIRNPGTPRDPGDEGELPRPPSRRNRPAKRERPAAEDQTSDGAAQETPSAT